MTFAVDCGSWSSACVPPLLWKREREIQKQRCVCCLPVLRRAEWQQALPTTNSLSCSVWLLSGGPLHGNVTDCFMHVGVGIVTEVLWDVAQMGTFLLPSSGYKWKVTSSTLEDGGSMLCETNKELMWGEIRPGCLSEHELLTTCFRMWLAFCCVMVCSKVLQIIFVARTRPVSVYSCFIKWHL
jgi:hypothetical protein